MALVEAGEETQELAEVLVVLVLGSHPLEFHEHVYEDAHRHRDGRGA